MPGRSIVRLTTMMELVLALLLIAGCAGEEGSQQGNGILRGYLTTGIQER